MNEDKTIRNIKDNLDKGRKSLPDKDFQNLLLNYVCPDTSGNQKVVQETLSAYQNILNAPYSLTYDVYLEILNQCKYWVNVFEIKNPEKLTPDEIRIFKLGMSCAWMYMGCIFHYDKESKELIPLIPVDNPVFDAKGRFLNGCGVSAYLNWQYGKMSFDFEKGTYQLANKDDKGAKKYYCTKDDSVFLQWNTWCIPNMIVYGRFAFGLRNIQDMIESVARITTTKLIYRIKDEKATKEELKSLLNPKSSVLIMYDYQQDIKNKLETIELDSESTIVTLIDYLKFYRDWFYSMQGRRWNNSEKRERNVTMEVGLQATQFSVLEMEHWYWIQTAFKEMKDRGWINFELIPPTQMDGLMPENNQSKYDSSKKGLNNENN